MVEPNPPANYPPPYFFSQDIPSLVEVIEHTKFSTLFIGLENDVIFAPLFIKSSSKPSLLDGSSTQIELFGHLSFQNPLRLLLEKGPLNCKIVFNCADMYVTPSIYQKKKKTGEVVPTWDYVAAQLSGVMTMVEGEKEFRELLAEEVSQFEKKVGSNWKLTDAPEGYIKGLMRNIVGIKITSTKFKVHKKLHQNYPKNEIQNVEMWASVHENKERTVHHWIEKQAQKQ